MAPQADRIRGQQERTVAIEVDQRAERTGRMAGQRQQNDAGIAERPKAGSPVQWPR
jgi:hypothetical protein